MSSKNQRLNATITIGSVLEASVKRNVGFLKTGLMQVGDAIKTVERRQKELGRQRDVLRKQGQSVERLDREYERLERRLKDLRRAQERWNRAAAASRRVGSTFNSMATDIGRNARRVAIGATLAGGAVFGLANSTATLGDEAAKTADKLGIGIIELQELRYAAERAGVETATFDKSLEKMVKNIGLAMEGTGAQADALDLLGLSAENLAKMLPEEALGVIADRLQGIETQAQKAAIANDLFGRSGVGLLNMLREGSRGLDEMRRTARRTGYVLSEEAARDAEEFKDVLLDTELILKGLKNTVGAELLPVVTGGMRRLGDAILENRGGLKAWSERFASGVERVLPLIGQVASGVMRVTSTIWRGVTAVADFVGGWENFGIVVGAVLASRTVMKVAKFGAAVFSLGRAMWALALSTPVAAAGIRAIGAALLLNPIGAAVTAIAGGAYLIYRNWEDVGPWFRERWGDVRETFVGFAQFVGGVFTGNLSRAWQGIKSIWSGYTGFFQGIWDGIGAIFTAAWKNAIKPVMDALGATEGIAAAWQATQTALAPVLDWIGQAFQTALGYIKPVIEALKWVFEKGAAAVEIINKHGQATKTRIDAISKRGNTGPQPGPGAVLQTNARGGPFRPGWHLTGETGPELKFENRSGYVANNRAMRQLANFADRASQGLTQRLKPDFAGDGAAQARVEALFARTARVQANRAGAMSVVNNHTYNINATGVSADEVINRLDRRTRRAAGNALYDRVSNAGPYGR